MSALRSARRPRFTRTLLAALAVMGSVVLSTAAPAGAAVAPSIPSMSSAVAVIPPLAYGGTAPATVTFDGSGSYCLELCSLVSWSWSFGDGATATGPQASHVYTESGLYTVTLTVTSNTGLTGTATAPVNIFANTQAVMSLTPSSGLMPLPVSFDGTASVTNWDRTLVSYAWDFGDGSTGTGATATHVYTTPGVRQATLTVTDSRGVSQAVGAYVYVQDPMLPPNNVRATSPTKGTVKLTWTNRMVAVDHLGIERCAGASCTSFVQVSGVPGTMATFQESGLRSGTTFRYRLRVYDYLGRTGVSAIVSVKSR